MTTQAVIFDRDLTLLTLDPDRIAELDRRIQALAPGLCFRDIYVALERWDGVLPATPDDEPLLWQDLVGGFGERCAFGDAVAEQLVALLAPYYTYFTAFPDSIDVVTTLARRGYQLAVFTNAPLPSVAATLTCGGISPGWFTVVESRATLRLGKPDPAVFFELAARLGVRPDECAVVDDQEGHVLAARSAGFHAWHLDRAGNSRDAQRITSLTALLNLLPECARAVGAA